MIKRKLALLVVLLALVGVLASMLVKPSRKPASTQVQLGSIVRLVAEGHTFCSGTVISHHMILTAAHCVVMSTPFGTITLDEPITIRDNDNIERGVSARPISVSTQTDHAILYGDFSKFSTRPLLTDPAKLTEIIERTAKPTFTSCGYPLGGNLYCSELKYVNRLDFFWSTSGTLQPGMSGGPAMIDGFVVGTNYAVTNEFSLIAPTFNILENVIDSEKE